MIITPDTSSESIPNVRLQNNSDAVFDDGPSRESVHQEAHKVADEIGTIASLEKIRADQTAVEEAQARGSKLTTDVLYDPDNGVLGSQGKDALQAQKDGMQRFKSGMNDISSSLNGPAQVGAFNKWALAQGGIVDKTMMVHVDQQLRAHDAKTFDNLVDNQAGAAATAHGDPDALALSFGTVKDNLDAYATRNRLDADQKQVLAEHTFDKMHSSVIDGLLTFQGGPSAEKYYQDNKDQISPKTQVVLEKALAEGDTRYKAQENVLKIIQANPDSESDALKEADKIDDADTRDAARKMITARFTQDRQARKNDQDSLFMQMSQMVNQKGLVDPIDRRNAVPPLAWSKLSVDQQRAIEKGGSVDETSVNKWMDFRQAMKDNSLQKMSEADIKTKFLQYMTPADQKTVIDAWTGAKGGPKNAKFLSAQSIAQNIDTSASSAGLIKADARARHETDKDQLKLLDDSVNRNIIEFESANKRSPNPEEIQGIIDKQVISEIGKKRPGFFERLGTKAPVAYENIPEQAKQQIIGMAKKYGATATRTKIENAYQMHRQGRPDSEIEKLFK